MSPATDGQLSIPCDLDERVALVFQDSSIRLLATIERHADLPWARKDIGIFNRCFVQHMVGASTRITFYDM